MQYYLTSAAWVIADTVEELSGHPVAALPAREDPEVDFSVAFYNNGYPATGYHVGRSGKNCNTVDSALADDIIDD